MLEKSEKLNPAANEGERWGQFAAGFFVRIRCDPDK
jgi:hypothetical protein